MRILFVIPTLTGGGAERAMSNITTHLPKGVDADILVNSVSDLDYPTDAKVYNLGMRPVNNKSLVYQVIAAIRRIFHLKKLKKAFRYDACISFMDSANICNILSGKNCKVIISVRIQLSKSKSMVYKCIVSPFVKCLYNRADNVVAVSEGIKQDLIDIYRIKENKIVTITNGFDISEIEKKASEDIDVSIDKDKFIFIAVGRYSNQKGHWHLIRAFSEVVRKCGKNVQLIILGQGPLKHYLNQIIDETGLKESVTLMPYSQNPYAIMRHCSVYVIPSLYEGYSNSLCEAIICGLPCIATDFKSSAREILAPDTDYNCEIHEGIEEVKYGIITPVCSGIHYNGNEKLEPAEEYLAYAMTRMYIKMQSFGDPDYRYFDINAKVNQYLSLVL